MGIEIRQATADEMAEFGILGGYVYGGAFGDGPDNLIARVTRPEWTLCAFDDGKLATSFSTIPFTMRANGMAMPLAGVSTVGTQPEYRRRGLVRRIHTMALEQMRDAGQPLAALWASQAAIYQRYGYAMSPWDGVWRLETSPEGSHARPTKERPDIRLDAKTLTSLFTGFPSATELANWGLLDGDRDAVIRADAMFRTRHAPHCPDHF